MFKEIEANCKKYIIDNYADFFEFEFNDNDLNVSINNLHSKFSKIDYAGAIKLAHDKLENDEVRTIKSVQVKWRHDRGFDVIFNNCFTKNDFSCNEIDAENLDNELDFERICDAIVLSKECFIKDAIEDAFRDIDKFIEENEGCEIEALQNQCNAIVRNYINNALEKCWLTD